MPASHLATLLQQSDAELLTDWLREQASVGGRSTSLIGEGERRQQSSELLQTLQAALPARPAGGAPAPQWAPVRGLLNGI